MLRVKAFPSLLVVLIGSLDCLTTVIGILYFGAVECNPFLSGMVSTNLPAFVLLKSVTTVFVGLIFYQADKILAQVPNKTNRTFLCTRYLLTAAYLSVIVFLGIVVANNILVLIRVV